MCNRRIIGTILVLVTTLVAILTAVKSSRAEEGRLEPVLLHAWTPLVLEHGSVLFKVWLANSLASPTDSNHRFTGWVEVCPSPGTALDSVPRLLGSVDSVIVSIWGWSDSISCELRDKYVSTTDEDIGRRDFYTIGLDTCEGSGRPDSVFVSAFVASRTISDSLRFEETIAVTMFPVDMGAEIRWSTSRALSDIGILQKGAREHFYAAPFGPTYDIRYNIADYSRARVTILDTLGSVIHTPVDRDHVPGVYSLNLKNLNLKSGIYYFAIAINGLETVRKKMVVMQ